MRLVPRTFTVASATVIIMLGGHATSAAGQTRSRLNESASQGALSSQAGTSPERPDFLFGQPTKSVGIRASWLLPREGGDLFSFVHDQLTIDKGDFRTVALTGEFGVAISSRVSIMAGLEFSRALVGSEYRHFIGSDDLPIAQESSLTEGALNIGLKVALTAAGRRISRLAWIPRTVTPYVGGGAGSVHYNFTQQGDFVDYQDLSVFPQTFESRGWGPTAHVFGGADLRAWRNLYVTVEGRYVWAHAPVGVDFVGFDGIDLAGFRMASGVNLVF